MKRRRDYIDAKYEVVREAQRPAKWNGMGLPPEWPVWSLLQRVLYIVLSLALIGGVYAFMRWATSFIEFQL